MKRNSVRITLLKIDISARWAVLFAMMMVVKYVLSSLGVF